MASFVTDDGKVIPPLNISAPAPLINLRGFSWDAVDDVVQGLQPGHVAAEDDPSQDDGQPQTQDAFAAPPPEDGPPQMQEVFAAAQPGPTARIAEPGRPGGPGGPIRPGGPPGGPIAALQPVPLPAPQAPLSPEALGTQLPIQLGFKAGQQASVPPEFPLAQFQGAFAGNGFNLIFRPRPNNDTTPFPIPPAADSPTDNVLELNLTTEQLTFGRTIGKIPNRGLNLNNQADIFLGGLPYLQTIQDVTNPVTGRGDRANPVDIHFEPGMWLNVPATTSPDNKASVVRMASIPHGTTINAQAFSPPQAQTALGGEAKGPTFAVLDTTPFPIGVITNRLNGVFQSMDAVQTNRPRIPQNLQTFIRAGTITTDIIRNPNLVLQRAIQGLDIRETITFEVSTGPTDATLNGGGTANISFLAGTQATITTLPPDGKAGVPNAHAAVMTARFWIETVAYEVNVPRLTAPGTLLLKPTMPKESQAPTPVFAITSPPKLPSEPKKILVPGIQIQYSQMVNLNFAGLTWPHVSVATLVPTGPQPFTMT